MAREVKFRVIVLIIIAVLCAVFLFVNFINKTSINENYVDFFKQMISIENHNLIKNGKYEELANIFKLYCNERGLDTIMSNREIKYNYNFIEKNNIVGYKDLVVDLIEESNDNEINFKKYKITYTYFDNKEKEFKMIDYYHLNIKEDMIDYIKIDVEKSSIAV